MHKLGKQPIYQYAILVMLAVCLAGCAMIAANDGHWLVMPDQAGNRLAVTTIDHTAVLDIFSERGIGRANVQWLGGDYPAHILLRLHLRGLEELRFTYATTTLTLSMPSTGASTPQQAVMTTSASGQAEPVTPASPYWMKTAVTNGWIEVELPPAFVQGRYTRFAVQWVDFFR